MKDLALVVVGAVLTAFLARTWGHRRLLQHAHEQLKVLQDLPDNWGRQRRALEELADRDIARYIRYRNPSFPVHRLMSRLMDLAFVGILMFSFTQMTFTPGSDSVKAWIAAAGATIAAVAVTSNVLVLLSRRAKINAELEDSAKQP